MADKVRLSEELLQACEAKNFDLVLKLIARGAQPTIRRKDYANKSPLDYACCSGSCAVVQTLVENYDVDLNDRNKEGYTALHWASGNGHLRVVICLCSHGSNPQPTTNSGNTPLHFACRQGHLQVVSYLCAHGSNPQAADANGWTALHFACWQGHLQVVSYLCAHGSNPQAAAADGWTALHIACSCGHLQVVTYLCTHGSNPQAATNEGSTPLHFACVYGHLHVVSYLCTHGSNPQAATNSGNTPLHFACLWGHLQVVSYLCTHGSNPQAADNGGSTALHFACEEGHLNIMKWLISEGHSRVDLVDEEGRTPLHVACRWGRFDITKWLITKGHSEVDCVDKEGSTPLHFACRFAKTDVIKYLLREGHCNPNVANELGQTPLALSEHPTIVQELIRYGAHASDVYKLYRSMLPKAYPKKPTESAVKVFIVGKQGMGKTTLTTALNEEGNIITYVTKRMRQVSGVEKNTAGVIPHDIYSKKFGFTTIYDLAGHEEFYSGHELMLRSSIAGCPAVFLLVASINSKDEVFKQSILSWLAFLENQGIPEDPKPHVVIVGSHADQVNSKDVQNKDSVVTCIVRSSAFSSFHFAGFVPMDCRYAESPSMTKLRQRLAESCSVMRIKAEISVNCHCLYIWLLDQFQNHPAIRVQEALSKVQEESRKAQSGILTCIPDDSSHLCKLLQDLHERGNILILKDTEKLENSWLILDREAILSQITGTVFAPNPEDFKQYKNIASSTGVVLFSKIESSFPNFDPNFIVEFLCHFEFCHEITDAEGKKLLQVITATPSIDVAASEGAHVANDPSTNAERFFFFPGLVKVDIPDDVWQPSSQYGYHSGWLLQSSHPDKFFTRRFLHVLLIRLAFAFALAPDTDTTSSQLPTIQRKCCIWKNGIQWGDRSGTEALVLVEGSRRVNVMVRCFKGQEMECIHLRSLLIQKVLDAKDQLCLRVPTSESFLHPVDATSHPLKLTADVRYTSYSEIAIAITEGKSFVLDQFNKVMHLDTLLYFEPYAHLGECILRELSDVNPNYQKVISDEFLHDIADRRHQKKELFIDVFDLPTTRLHDRIRCAPQGPTYELIEVFKLWRERSEGSYQCLRRKLDQFSIFAGRNPLGALTLAEKGYTEVATNLRAKLNVTDKDTIPDTDEKKDGRETWEYRTFRKNSGAFAHWLGTISNAQRIANELYARDLIGMATRDAAGIYGPNVTEIMRITPIVKEMEIQIALKKENYKKFRGVLLLTHVLGPAEQDGMDTYLPANNPEEQTTEETKTDLPTAVS